MTSAQPAKVCLFMRFQFAEAQWLQDGKVADNGLVQGE